MSVLQVTTSWTTVSGGSKKSIQFWEAAAPESDDADFAREQVYNLFYALRAMLTVSTNFSVDSEVRVLNTGTGELEEILSDDTPRTASGTTNAEAVADSTQALIRWGTNGIVRGRRVRGRTFIPGLHNGNLSQGNLAAGGQNTINAAAADYMMGRVGLQPVVWSRPYEIGGPLPITVPGTAHEILSGVAWRELAVLRRRRR